MLATSCQTMATHSVLVFLLTFALSFSIAFSSPNSPLVPATKENRNTLPPMRLPVFHISKLLPRDDANLSTLANGSEKAARSKYRRTPVSFRGGQYVVRVRLGSDRQLAYLLLDTGSSLVWWQCEFPCIHCYHQKDNTRIYDPRLSSSYETLDCDDPRCDVDNTNYITGCVNSASMDCGYEVMYGNGDSSTGILAWDRISTDDGWFVDDILFGCGYDNIGDFRGHFGGIMGFGRGVMSFQSQFNITKFSFCLLWYDRESSAFLYLNNIPPPERGDDETFVVPMYINYHKPEYHYVVFNGFAIDNKMVPIDPNKWSKDSIGNYGVIIDTGTAITRFPEEMYTIFRDEFRNKVSRDFKLLQQRVITHLDTCYNLSSMEFLIDPRNYFPRVSMYFADKSKPYRVAPDQVMSYIGEKEEEFHNVVCLMFMPFSLPNWKTTLIGSNQLGGTRLSYDIPGKSLRLDRGEC